jgi:aspartate ammonia-lyase
MQKERKESDALGQLSIPLEALWGIHTQRAMNNFPISGRKINPALIHAYGAVKMACARTNHELGYRDNHVFEAIEKVCDEVRQGLWDAQIVVDALQGGAGTSTNMNINEVICNRALQILGRQPGEYNFLHPIDDINRHQSTNDTYPTALKVAAIQRLRLLQEALTALLNTFQDKEKEFAPVVKIARTQLQDAVLTTMGRTMGSYAEAVGRDRWRLYKCEERLRVVNLGGTAIGTGISAPRRYIFKVVDHLKNITGIGMARAENLVENTQNCDVYAEVQGILNACAVNLLKIAGDLRLMASGPAAGLGEINLPEVQAGSTIMPNKVNPVIPEAVSQAAMTVLANSTRLNQACAMGNLELNPFLPLIADALLESIDLLIQAATVFSERCVKGITVNEPVCRRQVENSTATLTALVGRLGYQKVQDIAANWETQNESIRDYVINRGLLKVEEFDALISAESVNRLGES